MIVQCKDQASNTPTQSRSISGKSKRVKQSKAIEFYYQGVGELGSLAATQIPPYGNLMASVCRGFAIKRGYLQIQSPFFGRVKGVSTPTHLHSMLPTLHNCKKLTHPHPLRVNHIRQLKSVAAKSPAPLFYIASVCHSKNSA